MLCLQKIEQWQPDTLKSCNSSRQHLSNRTKRSSMKEMTCILLRFDRLWSNSLCHKVHQLTRKLNHNRLPFQ